MERKRDNLNFICEIGELSGIFKSSDSLENFLQRIVEMISQHMNSNVCSIYLYDPVHHELVLSANMGLNKDLVEKLRLKSDQGLTGYAFTKNISLFEKNASQNPKYCLIPGLGEEQYESFVAVPIVRGSSKIGVVVIQNTSKDFFLEEDVKLLQTITSQLANTIEMTRLLMSFDKTAEAPEEELAPLQNVKMVKGRVGSPGFAFSQIFILNKKKKLEAYIDKVTRTFTLPDFYMALEKTEKQLERFQQRIEETLYDVASLIFTAQILMLKDQAFISGIIAEIEGGLNPPIAVIKVVEEFIRKFDSIENPYLQEKSYDIRDVGIRIIENLISEDESIYREYEDRIVIARDLLPSDILKMSLCSVKGIILLSGGITSHVSILAGSLQMPLIIADEEALFHLEDSTKVIMDAQQGNIYVNPQKDIIENFRNVESQEDAVGHLKDLIKDETLTKDGVKISLNANINLLSDLKLANELKAESVGLYRTEFPFIVRSTFPNEEEQYVIYKKLMDRLGDKEATFRTLDIGGDKVLSYYDHHLNEKNPFLGLRSIRFSLKHKEIFSEQIRAILRAGVNHCVRIMFPMISSMDELFAARLVVDECIQQLKKEGTPFNPMPKIGIMVEIPSILEIMEELAPHIDFFSVGTNDFVQYMLAIDRTNEKVSDMYLSHHPSILRALNKIANIAFKTRKELSICGEMANDPLYTRFLVGVGFRSLSLNPLAIFRIQKEIELITLTAAKDHARSLLSLARIEDINKFLGVDN